MVSVTESFGKNHLVISDCALLSQGGKDGQRRRTHLSPTQVSCSISVITSAISNFSRCEGEGSKRERVHKRKEEERRSTCTSQRQGRELCRTFSRFDSFATVTHFNVVQELLFPAPYVGQLIPLLQRKVFRYWEKKKKHTEQELREFEMDVFEGGARFK